MVYLPSKGYPMNKRGGIFQLFSGNGSCTSWAGMLTVVNNSLMFSHRTGCVTPTEPTLVKDIPRDRWIPVIVHVVVSRQQQGQVELWFDGASKDKPTYSAKNINFGFGVWRDDDTIEGRMHFTFGQYAWDESNYTPNETRVNYFDNIHIVNEGRDDGWEDVNPLTAHNQYTGAQVWANRQWKATVLSEHLMVILPPSMQLMRAIHRFTYNIVSLKVSHYRPFVIRSAAPTPPQTHAILETGRCWGRMMA